MLQVQVRENLKMECYENLWDIVTVADELVVVFRSTLVVVVVDVWPGWPDGRDPEYPVAPILVVGPC